MAKQIDSASLFSLTGHDSHDAVVELINARPWTFIVFVKSKNLVVGWAEISSPWNPLNERAKLQQKASKENL